MKSKNKCPLCNNEAIQMRDRSVYLIDCPSCGRFQITRECLDDLPAERKLLPQLMKVSAFTRHRTINNEPIATLLIGDTNGHSEEYSIHQVVDQFPSVPERKLKALQNLQGLSKYWGDAVSIERKDYPVFFPEVNEEQPSLMMIRTLVEEGLVSGEIKFPTYLTVTEKGSSLFRGQIAPVAPLALSPTPKAPVIEKSSPVVTQPSKLEGLHPKVLGKAGKSFNDGNYRSAVLDTYIALNKEVQRKSRLTKDGSSLMQMAFSKDKPVLKVAGGDDPQMGANWLFSGAMMGVRNVLAHDDLIHPSEQEALELLYFASMLFRRLDLAVNVEAEKLMKDISLLTFMLDGNYSYSNSAKLSAYLAPSKEYVDGELHRICFLKIHEMIQSGYYQDQNAGIKLLLEWEKDTAILDHVTHEDHIKLICSIYKAIGYPHPSRDADRLIREGFKSVKTSLNLFQDYMLSSSEVFNELLEKIWFEDAFFESISHYADSEFLFAFLNKVINKEIVLIRKDLNTLSDELYKAGREGLDELANKIHKMNDELNK